MTHHIISVFFIMKHFFFGRCNLSFYCLNLNQSFLFQAAFLCNSLATFPIRINHTKIVLSSLQINFHIHTRVYLLEDHHFESPDLLHFLLFDFGMCILDIIINWNLPVANIKPGMCPILCHFLNKSNIILFNYFDGHDKHLVLHCTRCSIAPKLHWLNMMCNKTLINKQKQEKYVVWKARHMNFPPLDIKIWL